MRILQRLPFFLPHARQSLPYGIPINREFRLAKANFPLIRKHSGPMPAQLTPCDKGKQRE